MRLDTWQSRTRAGAAAYGQRWHRRTAMQAQLKNTNSLWGVLLIVLGGFFLLQVTGIFGVLSHPLLVGGVCGSRCRIPLCFF